MRKEYSIPEMEIIVFKIEDVVKTSGDGWTDDKYPDIDGDTEEW